MSSIDLNMRSVQVEAKTRSLRATWTHELANDLDSYHNIDAHLLKEEIQKTRASNRKKSINKIFQN